MKQTALIEKAGYPTMRDDPETITEDSIPGGEHGPDTRIILCDWGYHGCQGLGIAEDMTYDSYNEGWACVTCIAAAKAEYQEWMDAARYS